MRSTLIACWVRNCLLQDVSVWTYLVVIYLQFPSMSKRSALTMNDDRCLSLRTRLLLIRFEDGTSNRNVTQLLLSALALHLSPRLDHCLLIWLHMSRPAACFISAIWTHEAFGSRFVPVR